MGMKVFVSFAVMVSTVMKILAHSSLCTFVSVSVGKIPRSGSGGKGEMCILNFDRYCPIVSIYHHPGQESMFPHILSDTF